MAMLIYIHAQAQVWRETKRIVLRVKVNDNYAVSYSILCIYQYFIVFFIGFAHA